MLITDWVALGLILLFAVLGLLLGFGRGLRFFTKGIFGFIISVIFCYFLGGLIIKFDFVQNLLGMLVTALTDKNTFCDVLLAIRIDIIVYYVALFIIVQVVRIIIVHIISKAFEIENVFVKIINRFFGMVIFLAALVLTVMLVFQIVCMIGGTAEANFIEMLSGSKLKLDWFYENNPLIEILEVLFRIEIRIPVEMTPAV